MKPVNQLAPTDLPVPADRLLNELNMGYLAKALRREVRRREQIEAARKPPEASAQIDQRQQSESEARS